MKRLRDETVAQWGLNTAQVLVTPMKVDSGLNKGPKHRCSKFQHSQEMERDVNELNPFYFDSYFFSKKYPHIYFKKKI